MNQKNRILRVRKYEKILLAASGVLIFIGVIAFVVVCEGGNITKIFPTWNDESGYYRQLSAMVKYGHPLGYNGYNGGHAAIGNFGFHGMFILLPYYLWAKVFGLSYMTISACNIFMAALAIFIFGLCTEGNIWKRIAYLGCIMTPMVVYYTATSMVEAENYFFAIVFAALLMRLCKNRENKTLIVAWVFIVLAILCKVTWAGMVFPFAFLSQKTEKKTIFRIVNSFLCMIIFMIIGYLIFSQFSSPYLTSVLSDYIAIWNQNGWGETFIYIVKNTIHNLWLTFAAINTPEYGLWFKVSALIVWLTFSAAVISIIYSIKQRNIRFFWPGFIMVGYMGGVTLMYSGGPVAIRTLYPVALLSLLLLTDLYIKKKSAFVTGIVFAFLTLFLAGFKKYDPREFYDQTNQEYIQDISRFYSKTMKVWESGNEWDNTVAVYAGDMPHFYYTMVYPAGMANNFYLNIPDRTEKFPKYALVVSEEGKWYEFLVKKGYVEIGSNEEVIVMADSE